MTTATVSGTAPLAGVPRCTLGPICWQPSADRQLNWRQYAGPSSRGRGATPLPLIWPQHPAGALLDYGLVFPEAVASASMATNPTDLIVASVFPVGNTLLWWMEGGTAGNTYAVAGAATMVSGRVVTFSGSLMVAPTPYAPAPGTPLPAVPGGTPLALGEFFTVVGGALIINISLLPTSPAGLPLGGVWNNGGTIAFVTA
jgi:hypothetical protein